MDFVASRSSFSVCNINAGANLTRFVDRRSASDATFTNVQPPWVHQAHHSRHQDLVGSPPQPHRGVGKLSRTIPIRQTASIYRPVRRDAFLAPCSSPLGGFFFFFPSVLTVLERDDFQLVSLYGRTRANWGCFVCARYDWTYHQVQK